MLSPAHPTLDKIRRIMRKSPKERAGMMRLLKEHPHFDPFGKPPKTTRASYYEAFLASETEAFHKLVGLLFKHKRAFRTCSLTGTTILHLLASTEKAIIGRTKGFDNFSGRWTILKSGSRQMRPMFFSYIRTLIRRKDVDTCAKDEKGRTLLHRAVMGDNFDLLVWLLQRTQIDINARDENGFNVLQYVTSRIAGGKYGACSYSQARYTIVLLWYGVDPRGTTMARNFKQCTIGYELFASVRTEIMFSEFHASVGHWRPSNHCGYTWKIRAGLRTLLLLAKLHTILKSKTRARIVKKSTIEIVETTVIAREPKFPQACLCLLPEELLQYMYGFVASNVPLEWRPTWDVQKSILEGC